MRAQVLLAAGPFGESNRGTVPELLRDTDRAASVAFQQRGRVLRSEKPILVSEVDAPVGARGHML